MSNAFRRILPDPIKAIRCKSSMQYFISKYYYYLLLLLFVSLFISGESLFLKLSSLCVAVAGPTNFAPIINQIARWVVDAIYKGAICFWVDKWFVSAQVWPNFHYFFSNSESICVWNVWSQGPVKAKMTLSGPILNQTALRPALIFPIVENSIFSCRLKDFSSFLWVLL